MADRTRDLTDAVVAVVGASGELGSRIASALAQRGAVVIPVGRDRERLSALGLGEPLVGDLTDAGSADALLARVRDAHGGRLDGVVLAAGVVAFGPLVETEDAVVEELFLTNVVGPLFLARRVGPLLAESQGFWVSLSAVLAEKPMAGMAAYSATKAALASATAALATEWRRQRVTVTDVRPPHTETGLAERPLAGTAPNLPPGLDPDVVAARVIRAIEQGEREVASTDF